MVSRTTFWEAVLVIGASAIVTGIVILATNGDVVNHGYGNGLILVGGLLVIVALIALFLLSHSRDDQDNIGGQIKPMGNLHRLVFRKQTEPNIRRVEFGAWGTSHWVGEDGKKVKAIRFTAPVEALVKPEYCPFEVRPKSGWRNRVLRFFGLRLGPVIIVHEFGQEGVLIEEAHMGEQQISADLYFETPEDF